MKRLTAILVAGIFVLAPLSASAMEMMEDSSMKDVTGQAGVSIAIDDVVLESWTGTTKYTDVDGADGSASTNGASVMISDQHTVQDFQAITGADNTDANPGAASLTSSGDMELKVDQHFADEDGNEIDGASDLTSRGYEFKPSALTIDVGTCEALSAGKSFKEMDGADSGVNVAGVVIGLPTLEINTSASSKNIGIEDTEGVQDPTSDTDGAVNSGKNFIKIEESGSTLHVLGGRLEIAPH